MKKLKYIFLLLLMVVTFNACTNDEDVNVPINIEESASLQNTIDQLKTFVDSDGNLIDSENPTGNFIIDFCFDFVYPVTLIYNNGSTVEVNGFEELILVILNSTEELYIVSIEFPFNVEWYNHNTNEVEIVTITNEEDFFALIESCFFDECDCTDEFDPVCVEVETENNTFVVITFNNACEALCEGFTEEDFVDCPNNCDCTDEVNPVCVETENGKIIQFDNECLAVCEGYTLNEIFDCPNNEECSISNLTVELGECNPNGVYPIIINFEYENLVSDVFDVYTVENEIVGTFPLAELPLTLTSAQLGSQNNGYLRVCVSDDPNCCADTEWTPLNCEEELCEIFNLTIEPAACNGDNTYELLVNFDVVNASNDFFDVFLRNNEYFATYAIADLPIVIQNFPLSGSAEDYIKVSMNDDPTESCFAETEWPAPDCGNPGECDCPDVYAPVCVEIGDTVITYYNECYAQCDGFENVFVCNNNECEDCINQPYEPLCVEVDGAVITMYNECFLFCNGFTPNNLIDCE